MQIDFTTRGLRTADCAVLVVGLRPEAASDSAHYAQLDRALDGRLPQVLARAGFVGRLGQVVEFPALGQLGAVELVVVVGLGQAIAEAARVAAAAGRARLQAGADSLGLFLDLADESALREDAAGALGEGLGLGGYAYQAFLPEARRRQRQLVRLLVYSPDGVDPDRSAERIREGLVVARAQNLARDLVNAPPNEMNPESLRTRVESLAQELGTELVVLDEEACAERGMGAFLAVGQGSAFSSALLHLRYRPEGARTRLCLVGKALTYDAGGLCLKPATSLPTMKLDMGGAAAVIGAFQAVVELGLPVELDVICAATENMTGAAAYRPGDILRASNGVTIEVGNTDAEGRLTLADALVYACQQRPAALVDLATLTGASKIALGPDYSALFSRDEQLAGELLAAGERAGEGLWRLPLPSRYRDLLKSEVAAIKNVGPRWGGAITAALFLAEFVDPAIPWAHLDIAGPVFRERGWDYRPQGATGHPVRALVEFVRTRCGSAG